MRFFSVTCISLVCLFLGYGSTMYALIDSPSNQIYRTGYHFQPRKNFMNDPNGPMLYNGIYHLFYQYNPIGHGSSAGPRIWGHATSTDLVNWALQPNTLKPQTSSNNLSSWSGSATILPGNKPVILYTGLNSQNQQVQIITVPKTLSDPYLKEWILLPQNPIIAPTRQNNINASNFRDPTTAWILPDGTWRMIIGTVRGNRGIAMLFRSKDFLNWFQAKHPLYSEKNGGMWECPDFYPVYVNNNKNNSRYVGADTSKIGPNVKHVLKMSLLNTQHDVYTIGTYNIRRDIYFPDDKFMNESSLRYDYGTYYASKTFYDGSKKRRILFGWVKEGLPDGDVVKIGWAGIQAIPRSLWLDSAGKQLIQWPVKEVETLRGKRVRIQSQVMKAKSLFEISGITAAQADVEVSFNLNSLHLENAEKFDSKWSSDPQSLCKQNGMSKKGVFGPFGLLTLGSKGLEEFTGVFFRVFNSNHKPVVLMCSDQTRSSVGVDSEKTVYGTYVDLKSEEEALSLRVLIDNSVVESFGGKGRNVITARVYPTLAIGNKARLYLFNNGSQDVEHSGLDAWSMNTARIY